MPDVSQSVAVFSDQEIKVGFASTQGQTDTFTKKIQWDTKLLALSSATATIDAKQTYESGATLDVFINGKKVHTIHWQGGQATEQVIPQDVTSAMFNGDNEFKLQYALAFGAITDQIATVTMSILMTFTGDNKGKNPVTSGDTKSSDFWRNLSGAAKTAVYIIVTIVVIGGIAVIVSRFTGFGLPFKLPKMRWPTR